MTDPSDFDDPLLARPGVMRALWWSHCRGCDARIEVGDVQGLADLPGDSGGRAWVCRGCLMAVPEQRTAPQPDARASAPADPMSAAP